MNKKEIKKFAIALYEAAEHTPSAKLTGVLKEFVALLADTRMLSQADQIIAEFKRYYNRQQNIVEVAVETKEQLPAAEKTALSKKLAATTGKKIELTETINPEIIGGIVIKHDDVVIDASLKQRLQTLRKNLSST